MNREIKPPKAAILIMIALGIFLLPLLFLGRNNLDLEDFFLLSSVFLVSGILMYVRIIRYEERPKYQRQYAWYKASIFTVLSLLGTAVLVASMTKGEPFNAGVGIFTLLFFLNGLTSLRRLIKRRKAD